MLHWLSHELSLSFTRSLMALVTIAIVVGVVRTFVMAVQHLRDECTKKFYPIFAPAALAMLAATQYVPVIRTYPVFYPKSGEIVLAAVVLLIAVMVVVQIFRYTQSLLPGGTTPAGKWYKAWPLRVRRGAVPFVLTWVLSMLVLAIFLQNLAATLTSLTDASSNGVATNITTLAQHCMDLANFSMKYLPVVFLLWLAVTAVIAIGRGLRNVGRGFVRFMRRLAGHGAGSHP